MGTYATDIRRASLSALNALDKLKPAVHPDLRQANASALIDVYDAQIARAWNVLRQADSPAMQTTHEFRVEAGNLAANLQKHAQVFKTVLTLGNRRMRRLPGYLENTANQIGASLDAMEGHIIPARAQPDLRRKVLTAATASGETLADVIDDILQSAKGKRNLFGKHFKVPNQFRELLQPDDAIKTLTEMLPKFSANDRRVMIDFIEDEQIDWGIPKAEEFNAAYERAIASFLGQLRNGFLYGGGSGQSQVGKTVPRSNQNAQDFTLATRNGPLVTWEMDYCAVPHTMFSLRFRFSLTEKGLAKVLTSFIRNATKAMQGAKINPAAEIAHTASEMDAYLKQHNKGLVWTLGDAHTRVEPDDKKDSGRLRVTLELTRTVQIEPDRDPKAASDRMTQILSDQKDLMGNRSTAEQAAEAAVSRYGWTLEAVQAIRDRASEMITLGYRYFFSVPAQCSFGQALRLLHDVAFRSGREKNKYADRDVKKEMDEFESEFGVARSHNDAKNIKLKLMARDLANQVREMQVKYKGFISRNMELELEKLIFGLEHGDYKTADLVFKIPNYIEDVEERLDAVRTGSVSPIIDASKLAGLLGRTMPRFTNELLRRAKYHGLSEDQVPTRKQLIEAIVAQAQGDRKRFSANGDTFVVSFKHKMPAAHTRFLTMACPELTLDLVNHGTRLTANVRLSASARRHVGVGL